MLCHRKRTILYKVVERILHMYLAVDGSKDYIIEGNEMFDTDIVKVSQEEAYRIICESVEIEEMNNSIAARFWIRHDSWYGFSAMLPLNDGGKLWRDFEGRIWRKIYLN